MKSEQKEDSIVEFSNRINKLGYDDDLIKKIINNNKEFDDQKNKLKSKKIDFYFKIVTTIYLSVLFFFSKEVWELYKKSLESDVFKYGYIMAIVFFSLIVIGIFVILYALDVFFLEPRYSEIKYFNDSLNEVLIYRKLNKTVCITVTFNPKKPLTK